MRFKNFVKGTNKEIQERVQMAQTLKNLRKLGQAKAAANRAGVPRPGNRSEPHMRGYTLNRGAIAKHRYPYHLLSQKNRRLSGLAGLRILEASMNPKPKESILASNNNWWAYNYGRGKTLRPSARQIAAEEEKAAAKAAKARSSSTTRKSPHSRPSSSLGESIIHYTEDGVNKTIQLKNMTLDADYLDSLTEKQLDWLMKQF
jgi:hypothetical protein